MSRAFSWPPTYPSKIVTTTTAQTGTWFAISCLEETTFSTLTLVSNMLSIDGTIASVVFPAGAIVYGAFTNFTLASGAVMAHDSKATSA